MPPSLLPEREQARLDDFYQRMDALREYQVGYPCNFNFDYSPLNPLLGYMLNNVGDPFAPCNLRENTHEFEREVVREFAEMTHADPAQHWGYVTNGGTEGNMYGLFLAREIYPQGIVYYSEDTHYSVAKILRLTNMRSIMIRRQANGELDYEDLRESLRLHRDVPPIFFLNAGTTMTGAIDRLAEIKAMVKELCLPGHYIHVDAALMGCVLPFCEGMPAWDFAGGVDSLAVSGHKFIGTPIPCGVVLAKKAHVDRIARSVEYVGALDTTIMGSRNAITPMYLWYALKSLGREGLRRRARQCLETAGYAIERLRAAGIEAWRNEPSITVVFPRPSAAVFQKWTIAPYGEISHIITMPHVTRETVDRLTADLAADARARLVPA